MSNGEQNTGAVDLVEQLKAKIKNNGLAWTEVCAAAGVAHTTYWRWMQEPPKSIKIFSDLSKAVDYLAAQKSG